jgi:valyl-tRNA synthetase
MKRFHARLEVVKALKEMGLFLETKDNPMQIPICRRVLEVVGCVGLELTTLTANQEMS